MSKLNAVPDSPIPPLDAAVYVVFVSAVPESTPAEAVIFVPARKEARLSIVILFIGAPDSPSSVNATKSPLAILSVATGFSCYWVSAIYSSF